MGNAAFSPQSQIWCGHALLVHTVYPTRPLTYKKPIRFFKTYAATSQQGVTEMCWPATRSTTLHQIWYEYSLYGCTLTSAGAKAQRSPSLAARAGPSEEGRSRITADAPFCTRRSTVARPRPDAPPVTRPTIPCQNTQGWEGRREGAVSVGAREDGWQKLNQ